MGFLKSVRHEVLSRLPPREVEVARLVTGGFAEFEHSLLADSPHVAFLREFGDADAIDFERFSENAYFQHGCRDIERLGSFFGITEPKGIIEQAQYFLALFRAIRDGQTPLEAGRRSESADHSTDTFPKVARIRGRGYFVIRDGHHRCAIHLVLGTPRIRARVVGSARLTAQGLDALLGGPANHVE